MWIPQLPYASMFLILVYTTTSEVAIEGILQQLLHQRLPAVQVWGLASQL